jgi:hypothetical protein
MTTTLMTRRLCKKNHTRARWGSEDEGIMMTSDDDDADDEEAV